LKLNDRKVGWLILEKLKGRGSGELALIQKVTRRLVEQLWQAYRLTGLMPTLKQPARPIFSKEKDSLISRVRWRLEKGLIRIPNPEKASNSNFFTLVQQMKAYHYNERTGKPVKVNDHCCDSVICAMKHVETSFPPATFHDFTQYVSRRSHSKS
jgi:hypothetical protein